MKRLTPFQLLAGRLNGRHARLLLLLVTLALFVLGAGAPGDFGPIGG